jgi:hypothetical protein
MNNGRRWMPTVRSFEPRQPYLGPDGLRVAVKAYETALHTIDENVLVGLSPHRARRLIARYVMRQALRGQRDPERLREGAVNFLKRVAG